MTVVKATIQLEFQFGTAEGQDAEALRANDSVVTHLRTTALLDAPKPNCKHKKVVSATMEEVVSVLHAAFCKVEKNKGAAGPDRQSIKEVREQLLIILPRLQMALLDGSYIPGDIRRVWIPKSGGGQRGLGIPNVIDRMVQEAVRQVIEPLYEPTFHASSHGFRPGRSCHTAIAEAQQHIAAGYEWVVDLDLEKFFDKVNHQRLMSRLAMRITDKRVLVLLGRMLKAQVVMPDGIRVSTEEGVPQGGPLSPLLSNIVLDELDQELSQRGHRFVRYADDQNIYVKSERAGQRVKASIVRFIEKRLRLKVNEQKSAVGKPSERHFLGFCLCVSKQDEVVDVLLSKRSKARIDAKICELTPRNRGQSLALIIRKLNQYLVGWMGFFGICTERVLSTLNGLDAHIRRRLRAIHLKHWKCKWTQARKLIYLGARHQTAWRTVYDGRKSIWALSHTPVVERALRNAYFAERGLVSLKERWVEKSKNIVVPVQLTLALG